MDRLDVANFHQVAHRWIERAKKEIGEDCLADARAENPMGDEHDQLMPLALANAIYSLGPMYDAIIVDEGQDFGDDYWMPIEMLLTSLEDGLLYVFLDENQDIYTRSGHIPISLEPIVLDKNCRMTAAIHRAAYRHYRGVEVKASEIEGVPVEVVNADQRDRQAKSIASLITRLVAEEHIPPHHIAVLICDHDRKKDYERALQDLPIPGTVKLSNLEGYGEGVLTVDTVRRFKGLERPVIILWGFDHCDAEMHREIIYVGMSRATSVLYLVGSKAASSSLFQEN